ncbi:MAG: hypothetical protein ACHQD9_07220, partial [Chitinophagales bacterium]
GWIVLHDLLPRDWLEEHVPRLSDTWMGDVWKCAFEVAETPEIDFRIVCGKGYYVRSLVHDFGKLLGAGAYLSKLCRTRIGDYKLEDAWQIKDFVNFVKPENLTA